MMTKTFGSRVVDFYRHLTPPRLKDLGVDLLFPYRDATVREVASAFYRKFFDDSLQRVFLIGINPGRFGGGTTGIPFTDPVSLEKQCGIPNPFPKRRELSAEFIQALIDRFGGPGDFYQAFFVTAVSPVGFMKDGRNYNYYDDPKLLAALRPFIVKNLRAQLAFGTRRDVALVLGTGRNFEFFSRLNSEEKFFAKLLVVEHPRFIMQYKRPHVGDYLDKYEGLLRRVPGQSFDESRRTPKNIEPQMTRSDTEDFR
jgi:hypothetical protein